MNHSEGTMREPKIKKSEFAERMERSAEAKKALLAKFVRKPTVTDPGFDDRETRKAAEIEAVRQARIDAKEAARQAKVDAEEAAKQAEAMTEEGILAAKRNERKERKAQAKSEARAKKEARQSERRTRVGSGDENGLY